MRWGTGAGKFALRRWRVRGIGTAVAIMLSGGCSRSQAQAPEAFSWVNLHTDTATVAAGSKALVDEHYTALREIGVVGDQALIITTTRLNPAARPEQDHYTAYSLGLKDASEKPVVLLSGYHLQIRDWLRFKHDGENELVATYDDCADCRATLFLTAFYIDPVTKKWKARWPREVAGAPMYSAPLGSAGEADQVYALMVEGDGHAVLATWFSFPEKKGADGKDYLFEYDVDPVTGVERARPILGGEAAALKLRLCTAGGAVMDIAAGQATESCKQLVLAAEKKVPRHSSRHKRVYTKPLVGESRPH